MLVIHPLSLVIGFFIGMILGNTLPTTASWLIGILAAVFVLGALTSLYDLLKEIKRRGE